MSLSRRGLILGTITLGLTGYGLWQLWGGPRSATAQASSVESESELDQAAVLDAPAPLSVEHQRERALVAAAAWPADPFRQHGERASLPPGQPTRRPAGPQDTLTLNGIISGPSPLAMISGRIVAVGDQLGPEITVAAIDDDSVVLHTTRGDRTLALPD